MKSTIKINKSSGLAYIPQHIRHEGYIGCVDYLSNQVVLILIKPGMSLDNVKDNLKSAITGIELMLEYEAKGDIKIVNLEFGVKEGTSNVS